MAILSDVDYEVVNYADGCSWSIGDFNRDCFVKSSVWHLEQTRRHEANHGAVSSVRRNA